MRQTATISLKTNVKRKQPKKVQVANRTHNTTFNTDDTPKESCFHYTLHSKLQEGTIRAMLHCSKKLTILASTSTADVNCDEPNQDTNFPWKLQNLHTSKLATAASLHRHDHHMQVRTRSNWSVVCVCVCVCWGGGSTKICFSVNKTKKNVKQMLPSLKNNNKQKTQSDINNQLNHCKNKFF